MGFENRRVNSKLSYLTTTMAKEPKKIERWNAEGAARHSAKKMKKENLTAVGFEPTSSKTSVLETDPLDRSGKRS